MIVSVGEHWTGRGASEKREGEADFTLSYLAVSNSAEDDATIVLADSRIPAMYTVHPKNLNCRVVDRDAKQESEGYFTWMVNVTYSSKWFDQAKSDPNPLARPDQESWSTKDTQEPFVSDLDDVAVVTTTEETFDPPIMRDVGRLVLSIEKNLASVDPQTALEFHHAINDTDFRGFPAGQAKIMSISWAEQFEGESSYQKLRLTIEFNANGWEHLKPLNQGYMELDPNDITRYRQILDRSGQPISKPRLLDENGQQLDLTSDPPQDPVFLSFRAYQRKDFTLLGIWT